MEGLDRICWSGIALPGVLHLTGVLEEGRGRAPRHHPLPVDFWGGGKAGGVPGVLLRAGRASPSLLAEPAAQGRKRKQERGGVGRENVNSTGPGAWLAASPAGSPPCGPPPGRLPPAPHCWGLPLPTFAPGSPSTEHLLAQQGRDWAAPGVAGESRVLSIATQSPRGGRGGREMGGRREGCWAHPGFGTGKWGLAWLHVPTDSQGFSSILALLFNWGVGW